MTSTHLEQSSPALNPGAAPSSLVSISATADGAVWVADSSGALYSRGALPEGWTPVAGSVAQIAAAADGTVLGLAPSGGLIALVAGAWQPFGVQPPSALAHLAVAGAQSVWGTDASGTPLMFDGTSWTPQPGVAAVQVSAASDGSAWALDHAGAVHQSAAGGWAPIAAPVAMTTIAGAEAGWLWAIDGQGGLHRWDGSEGWPTIDSAPGVLVGVACGDDGTVWAQDTASTLWSYDTDADAWEPLPVPSAAAVAGFSVGSVTQAWAVDTSEAVYHYGGAETWQPVPGTASVTCVSASGANDVWFLTSAGEIFRSQGRQWAPIQVAGALRTLSAAADGTVWGVNADGGVFSYGDTGWTQITGKALTSVAVGSADLVFGLDAAGEVLQYTTASGWGVLPAPGTSPASLAAGSDGLLWATDESGRLLLLTGGNPPWYTCGPTALRQVSAATAANLWGIGENCQAVGLSGAPFGEAGVSPASESHRLRWDTESVFDETESTHLWIVNRAAVLAGQQGGEDGEAIIDLIGPFLGRIGDGGFHDNFCQGLYDADFKAPYNDPGFFGLQPMYYSHFYEPHSGQNYDGATDPTALTRGRSLAAQALDCYWSGDLAGAGYALGLALHYFTDVTQPMHATNRPWQDSVPPGWHSEFERRTLRLQADVPAPTTLPPNPGTDLDAYFVAAARTAEAQLGQVWPIVINVWWLGFSDTIWKNQVAPHVPAILQGAIQQTAQFLVAWMRWANHEVSPSVMVSNSSGLVAQAGRLGSTIVQTSVDGAADQQCVLSPLPAPDTDYYRIAILGVPGGGFDVYKGSTQAGAKVVCNRWNNVSSQKWKLTPAAGGSFALQNQNSGLYLAVSSPTNKGSALIQASADGQSDQQWLLAPAGALVIGSSAPGGLVLDVTDGSNSPGKPIQVYTAKNSRNQQWQLVPVQFQNGATATEVFAILSLQSGLALNAQTDGTVVQATWSGTIIQMWLRVENDDGTSALINYWRPGAVLTAAADKAKAAVVLQPDDGSALQRWTLTPPST